MQEGDIKEEIAIYSFILISGLNIIANLIVIIYLWMKQKVLQDTFYPMVYPINLGIDMLVLFMACG